MKKPSVIIVGAGIVGLATALKILKINPKISVAILEKEDTHAKHQTGNNSGVIHAGVYYKPGSLKALNCREGYLQLVDFCKKENVHFELCGKLIIATGKEEIPRLDELYIRAQKNGLTDVAKINKGQIKEIEPHATGEAALMVPNTGIVDYHEVASKYAELVVDRYGGQIIYNSEVKNIVRKNTGGIEVITSDKTYSASLLINTAGLYSDKITEMTHGKINTRIIPFRGEYVELVKDKQYLVKNLIYPVPDPRFPFLGVHFTRMIQGGVEAGPNAVWAFSREGYDFKIISLKNVAGDLMWPGFRKVMRKYGRIGLGEYYRSFSKKALCRSVQKLIPEISKDDFERSGAGVRAQACDKNGGLIDDFLIIENKWSINVLNAPSPAATASLSIGDTIAGLAMKRIG